MLNTKKPGMGTITVANTSGNLSEFSSLQPHSLTMDMYNPLPHFFFFLESWWSSKSSVRLSLASKTFLQKINVISWFQWNTRGLDYKYQWLLKYVLQCRPQSSINIPVMISSFLSLNPFDSADWLYYLPKLSFVSFSYMIRCFRITPSLCITFSEKI